MSEQRTLLRLRRTWERLGSENPMWAVLTAPGEWDEAEFFATGAREVSATVAYLEALEVSIGRGRALDFGCGVGRLTRALGEYFDTAVGVDISDSMVAGARELNGSRPACSFHHNPRPDLGDFESGSFDLVYSNITLQHMAPALAKGYIAEFVRVLSDRGVAVFQLPAARIVPGPPWLAGARRGLIKARLVVRHRFGQGMQMHSIPKHQVLATVEANGGRTIDVHPDGAAGPAFEGYRYAVVRSGAPARSPAETVS